MSTKVFTVGSIVMRDYDDLYRDVMSIEMGYDMGNKDWSDIKQQFLVSVGFLKKFEGILHLTITSSDKADYLTLQMFKSIWMFIMGQGSTTYPTYWKNSLTGRNNISTAHYQKWLKDNVPSEYLNPNNLHELISKWVSNRKGLEHLVSTVDLLLHTLMRYI